MSGASTPASSHGFATVLGATTGIAVHTMLVAFGISVLIVTAPALFWTLKIVGALYLVWSWAEMLRADVGSVRQRAAAQDEAEWAVLAISLAATFASLGAIALEIHSSSAPGQKVEAFRLVLAASTIVVSWLFIHTAITLHYEA